jgi:hypothetical protein
MASSKRTLKTKAAKRGRSARTKGHQFEREVAIQLRHIFPGVRRHLEYQDVEANGVDLVGTGRFKIQCKKLKKYSSITAIDEIEYDRAMGEVPILVTAGDNKPPMAVLPFEDLIVLLVQRVMLGEMVK